MTQVPDPSAGPIVLFDGICNLCNGTVQYLIEQDTERTLRFASLQSPPGKALLERCGYGEDALAGIVLVDEAGCHRKSDAVLRIGGHLGWPHRAGMVFRVLPRRFRDFWYNVIADRRYDWFGQREACMMPTDDRRERFIEGGMYPPEEA